MTEENDKRRISYKNCRKRYLLLDGGTGSVLRTMGMPAGVSTEKWAYEHPEVIGELQRQYAEAGSDVIICTDVCGKPYFSGKYGNR